MRTRVVFLFLGLAIFRGLFFRPSTFDEPLQVKQVSEAEDRLTCLYFPEFMVKQVETSDKGAEQISIVPVATHVPECRRANVPTEIVISPDVWTGYVKGVRSPYLFLSGEDGAGLLYAFAVFDVRTGQKLFEDATHVDKGFHSIEVAGPVLTMEYSRAIQLDCSLFRDPTRSGGRACWEKAQRELHLQLPMPDCSRSYLRDAPDLPEDPSDIAFDVKGVWDGHQFSVTPVGDSALCAARP